MITVRDSTSSQGNYKENLIKFKLVFFYPLKRINLVKLEFTNLQECMNVRMYVRINVRMNVRMNEIMQCAKDALRLKRKKTRFWLKCVTL